MNDPHTPGTWKVLQDEYRRYGTHVVAGSGAGKSRWLGRYLIYPDFFRKEPIPTFVFDTGSTIDNFLHKLILEERDAEAKGWVEALWQRVRYINFAGMDNYVVPLPLLNRLPKEPPAAPAKRYVDTIKRLEPQLSQATIMGLPPLERAANAAGTILTLLGGSILDMADLVKDPSEWEKKIIDNMGKFSSLPRLMAELKEVKQTGSLLTRLSLFTFDEAMAAIFGGTENGLDLERVIKNKEVVLFHFPPYMERSSRDFAMRWVFWWLIRFLELRGTNKEPVSIVIDELADLGNFEDSTGQASFAKDLNYLVNTFMRNHNVWLTLAHQQMSQFSETISSYLFGMRTQIVGRADDRDSARVVASQLIRYDPYKAKDVRETMRPKYYKENLIEDFNREFNTNYPVNPKDDKWYTSEDYYSRWDHPTIHEVHKEPIYFAPIEQQYENANFFEDMPNLTFFRKNPEKRELFSIDSTTNKWAEDEKELLEETRLKLMQRDGRNIEDILAAISNRPSIDPLSTTSQSAPAALRTTRKGKLE